jgi:ribosome biogenesis GTPase
VFADIEALALRCRFADCTHTSEPGCAVQAALAAGDIDPGRWHNYLNLRDEREQQAAQVEARRQRKGEGRRPVHGRGRRRRE